MTMNDNEFISNLQIHIYIFTVNHNSNSKLEGLCSYISCLPIDPRFAYSVAAASRRYAHERDKEGGGPHWVKTQIFPLNHSQMSIKYFILRQGQSNKREHTKCQ